jgi:hypothetical protein
VPSTNEDLVITKEASGLAYDSYEKLQSAYALLLQGKIGVPSIDQKFSS